MNAQVLNIFDKIRPNRFSFSSLDDFQFTEGEQIDARVIVDSPNISLYCLDDLNRRAVFVETTADADLASYPFFYQAQFECAQRLIVLPYEDLIVLANLRKFNASSLVWIFSVGRCGSTLLSKVFGEVKSVLSLSEPDVFSSMVGMRQAGKHSYDQLTRLTGAIAQILCKPLAHRVPSTYVLKLRGSGIQLAELVYGNFPNAKLVFLYRNAIDQVRYHRRAFHINEFEKTIKKPDWRNAALPHVPLLAEYADRAAKGNLSEIEFMTLAWLSLMERYLTLWKRGLPMRALRYEDLIADPERLISDLFVYCELPPELAGEACEVLKKDSQEGSTLSRSALEVESSREFDEINLTQIETLLEEQPVIKTADYLLPGTL